MILTTERLLLRPWLESDVNNLFEYAKNPDVGPHAGWPPHKNIKESSAIIMNVLNGPQCFAICEKQNNKAIGTVELKLYDKTDLTNSNNECELGYWLGKPFWGRGYMTEAVKEILRHAFEDLDIITIWCAYYDGNNKSKRVQEKCGFKYHHSCEKTLVPLMNEIRKSCINYLTKEQWSLKYNNQMRGLL